MKVTISENRFETTFSELRVGEAFLIPAGKSRYIKSTVTRAIRFTEDIPPCNVSVAGNEMVQTLPDTEVIFK